MVQLTASAIFDVMRHVLPEIAQKADGYKEVKEDKNAILFTMRDPERFGRTYIFRFYGKTDWSLSTYPERSK